MGLVLVAEIAQGGQHRIGGCLSQAAEGIVLYIVAEFFQLIQVSHIGLSLGDLCEDFKHTFGADTAGSTLAAGFLHSKFQEEFGNVYHTVILIHNDQTAGAHHGTDGNQVVIVNGDIKVFSRDTAAGRSSGLCGLELLSAGDAAADFLDYGP